MPTKSPSRKRPAKPSPEATQVSEETVDGFASPELRQAFYDTCCERVVAALHDRFPSLADDVAMQGWRKALPKCCQDLHFTVLGDSLGPAIAVEGQSLFFRVISGTQRFELYYVDLAEHFDKIVEGGLSQDNPPTSHESPAASRPAKAKAKPSREPAPRPAADVVEGEAREILVSQCEPHPKNPKPTPAEVAEIKASFDDEGQLEPIDVRQVPSGRFQILSGETRWTAAQQLGWRHIKARVRECDDQQAIKYLAIFNSKRKVLDPIRKAMMIAHLTSEGGMTLEEAGKVYGLSHAGSASNLKRLLQLPDVWQQRIVAGELPESFARLLLPYVGIASVMEALDKSFREEQASIAKGKVQGELEWDSRTHVATLVENTLDDHLRPVDKETTFHYGYHELRNAKGMAQHWHYNGDYPRLFELTPEIEKTLAIVEVEIDGKLGRWASNAKAYDKLQIPLIKKRVDEREKAKAAKSRPADVDKSKPLTKAQLAERKRKATEQLQANIQAWRHQLLRESIAGEIADHPDVAARLVLAVACHRPSGISLAAFLALALDAKQQHALTWREVADVPSVPSAVAEIAQQILAAESRDKRYPHLSWAFVDDLAAALSIDVASVWRNLQLATKPPLFEAFFQLHNSDQLDALGDELGVGVRHCKTRAAKVKWLAGTSRTLKLPKSIAPLKAAKPATKKGGRA